MKTINYFKLLKSIVVLVLLIQSIFVFGEGTGGTHPGFDPDGLSVPIDGGILMAILAAGSLGTLLLKKKKEK